MTINYQFGNLDGRDAVIRAQAARKPSMKRIVENVLGGVDSAAGAR